MSVRAFVERKARSLVRFQAGAPIYFSLDLDFLRSYLAASRAISFFGTAISLRAKSLKLSDCSLLVSRFGVAFFIVFILSDFTAQSQHPHVVFHEPP